MFCEADAAAQGIFTGELRLTEGYMNTSNSKVPRAQRQKASRSSYNEHISPSFPIIFLQRHIMLRSVLSVTLGAVLLGVLQEFP
jgi:hypothetical protein